MNTLKVMVFLCPLIIFHQFNYLIEYFMYNKIIFYKSSIQNQDVLQLTTKYQSQLLHKKGNDFFYIY